MVGCTRLPLAVVGDKNVASDPEIRIVLLVLDWTIWVSVRGGTKVS